MHIVERAMVHASVVRRISVSDCTRILALVLLMIWTAWCLNAIEVAPVFVKLLTLNSVHPVSF